MKKLPLAQRRYAVVCDSHKKPGSVIARRAPYTGPGPLPKLGFWIDDDIEAIGCFTIAEAETVLRDLTLNNPRAVRFGKALRAIVEQSSASAHDKLQRQARACAVLVANNLPEQEIFA